MSGSIIPKKALIPISVGNPGFSTSLMISALSAIKEKYDELVFLIADDLQLYNKVANVKGGSDLSIALKSFKDGYDYFDEKRRWLKKVKSQLHGDIANCKWTFTNQSTFTDNAFYSILRHVVILYQTIPKFREDVSEAAREHFARTEQNYSEIQLRLSKFYIIEEIAINLRIRVCENICDEYYAFRNLKPLMNIYSGVYDISVFSLSGVSEENVSFSFFEFSNKPDVRWSKL